jgi:hypothetical protein
MYRASSRIALTYDFRKRYQELAGTRTPIEPLPHQKAKFRPKAADKLPLQHYLYYCSDTSRVVVAKTYTQLIRQFDYRFAG